MKPLLLSFLLTTLFSCQDNSQEVFASDFKDGKGLNVAFLIMEGTYNTELTAPLDIFHHTKFRSDMEQMDVFTIANCSEPITTFEGLQIQADFNYNGSYPDIDILVIPSAEHHLDSDLENKELIQFIQQTDETALYMTSHCDGAFLLAEAQLLNNVHCTTFPNDIKIMREKYTLPIVHDSVLFVHDGKYITSVGGAKSFEAALYLVELLYGKVNAEQIAEGMVIDWDLNSTPHYVHKQ